MGENDTERNLLRSLINASEKAANIARICRSNEQLLSLLVQEKSGTEANARFEHDFKTLADVLIQETIKHDVGNLFPELRESICGEESPNFTNTLGESVTISVGDTLTNTIQCLSTVLNGNEEAAEALANEVHHRAMTCFGRARNPVEQGIIWIGGANRPRDTRFERLVIRNYSLVTDITLEHLVQCSPFLIHIDVSGTSVTIAGVRRFKQLKPDCEVVATHLPESSEDNDTDKNAT
ncbi:inositol polyphosphate 1-phosphatase-like [Teleopsis dalmanni]|uniref:inositol polyphosphate 1-phosphatase-like n=1 Tax=Teleopsis dalmanni TaxID=139649 RepID=UPI0018CEF055|nr:inositol polyphosphate 1-phosphatase-like [Teleopsis dalmanni]